MQFYQATSNSVVTEENIAALARQINRVYRDADYVGSLVIPDGAPRPTLWTGAAWAPPDLSWRDFAGLMERLERFCPLGLVPWLRLW